MGLEALKEDFEERAAILEYEAWFTREEAEALAMEMTGYMPATPGAKPGQGELPGIENGGRVRYG